MSAKPPSEVAANWAIMWRRHNSIFGGGIESLKLAGYQCNKNVVVLIVTAMDDITYQFDKN